MNVRHVAFWLTSVLLAAVVFFPDGGVLKDATDKDIVSLLNNRLVDLIRDPWSLARCGRYVLVIVCLYVLARLQLAATRHDANSKIRWKQKGEVKSYGVPPWGLAKTAMVSMAVIAIAIFVASTVSMAVGLAVMTLPLFGSISGTGFRIIADDVGFDWNGFFFTWYQVESWTRRYVPAYHDENNGHGELWYLSVRLAGGRTLECQDNDDHFSKPFREHVADKFRVDPLGLEACESLQGYDLLFPMQEDDDSVDSHIPRRNR